MRFRTADLSCSVSCGNPLDRYKAPPPTISWVESVTRNEEMPNLVTRTPLVAPIAAASNSAIRIASTSGIANLLTSTKTSSGPSDLKRGNAELGDEDAVGCSDRRCEQ